MRTALLVLFTVPLTMAMQDNPPAADAQVAHIVFFELKDDSPAATKRLVSACHKYLSGHDGTVYYSTGTRGGEFQRDVNVQDFHVALHVVFANKAAHDKYQEHPRHLQFIEENKSNWASVRVFDSYVDSP